MKSVLTPQQVFSHVASPEIQRSKFDRSHGYKTTLDAGKLIPVFIDEALPGDTFSLRASIFARLATPIKPLMDNMFADIHFFSVPYRLVWDHWKQFNGEQKNPSDSTDFIIPQCSTVARSGYTEQSIFDYMGLPTKVGGFSHSALPLRAYNLIWNEWFRDENLQNSAPVPTGDGPDAPSNFGILDRNKRKDYFTSALPFAQKHAPVVIPLGGTAPLTGLPTVTNFNTVSNGSPLTFNVADLSNVNINSNTGDTNAKFSSQAGSNTNPQIKFGNQTGSRVNGSDFLNSWSNGTLSADLSSATATTINALREAFQIQRMYEKDARGGTRYTETIRAHFGVISPDARLQRPEFLGSMTAPININPIAQTAPTVTGQTPQGNLSAMGTVSMSGNGFVKSFTEHEIVIGLLSVRADLNYQQGLNRMWSRQTRFDFFWPSLAHLGEQSVLKKEIMTTGSATDNEVFGYQERYAEYRYKPSLITGKFRSNSTTPLDVWHLAQSFSAVPSLNSAFITENPPLDRVVAVPSEPKFLMDCYFNFITARPMPTYSVPGLIDHF
ncbi:MAG: major capsid protein [Microviridae sp.]|nr:MAG: major capsid protein [Microviridae sp.]